MLKYFFRILFLTILVNNGFAQMYNKVLPSNEFSEKLAKVVLDFRNDFKTIKGNLVPKDVGIDTYESTVTLPGSIDNYITVSHSVKDPAPSFQSVMYSGEDYDKAVKVYKNVFKLIKRTRVKWVDKYLANFMGTMEPPEGLNFTVSYLKVDISDVRYKYFITEVELTNTNFANWEVRVNISKKKLDTEILPDN